MVVWRWHAGNEAEFAKRVVAAIKPMSSAALTGGVRAAGLRWAGESRRDGAGPRRSGLANYVQTTLVLGALTKVRADGDVR